jgi:hypothetical protein
MGCVCVCERESCSRAGEGVNAEDECWIRNRGGIYVPSPFKRSAW